MEHARAKLILTEFLKMLAAFLHVRPTVSNATQLLTLICEVSLTHSVRRSDKDTLLDESLFFICVLDILVGKSSTKSRPTEV